MIRDVKSIQSSTVNAVAPEDTASLRENIQPGGIADVTDSVEASGVQAAFLDIPTVDLQPAQVPTPGEYLELATASNKQISACSDNQTLASHLNDPTSKVVNDVLDGAAGLTDSLRSSIGQTQDSGSEIKKKQEELQNLESQLQEAREQNKKNLWENMLGTISSSRAAEAE